MSPYSFSFIRKIPLGSTKVSEMGKILLNETKENLQKQKMCLKTKKIRFENQFQGISLAFLSSHWYLFYAKYF